MCSISAGCPQRTWTWGPRGQGAILLVNCDKDNPNSSAMDCMDNKVLDREGKDPRELRGLELHLFVKLFVLSLVTAF